MAYIGSKEYFYKITRVFIIIFDHENMGLYTIFVVLSSIIVEIFSKVDIFIMAAFIGL